MLTLSESSKHAVGECRKNLLIHILCINKHRKKGRSNPTTFAVTFVEVLVRSKFCQLVCHCRFLLLNFIHIHIFISYAITFIHNGDRYDTLVIQIYK